MLVEVHTRAGIASIAIVLSMAFTYIPIHDTGSQIEDDSLRMEQFGGGGGSLEEQCGSITFENMFEYSAANFDVIIDEDWDSAEVRAVAWVNNTLADDLRVVMDEFMEIIDPNKGGDEWFSTDEREFFRALASQCIEHTLTRIGIRDGPAHRGGMGIDWKNTSWEEDGVMIEEFNIVPPRHSQIRGCSSSIGGDCEEVPVIPNSERDCDTSIPQSDGVDECRVQLWLNATMTIPGVSNPDSFTLAFNASNMSGARLDFTFPPDEGLRLDMWDECEGRDVGLNESTAGGQAPVRGGCIGDGSSSYELIANDDGGLTLKLRPNGWSEDWPEGEDLFFDFTTQPIPVDDPPAWTSSAPSDGAWFPTSHPGESAWASWSSISTWFIDESGVSSLDIQCTADPSMGLSQGSDRSLNAVIPSGEAQEVTCEAVDSAMQTSGSRTWYLGVPFVVSSDSQKLSDPHPIILTPSEGWPELQVVASLVQSGSSQDSGVTSISGETTVLVPSSDMIPGEVWVEVSIQGNSTYSMIGVYDLGISKESSPPLIAISDSMWDGSQWSMQGQYSDPDGEAVSFTMRIDGSAAGSVSVSGNSWSTPGIDFSLWESGEHTVEIEGCDTSNKCTEISQVVNNSILFEVIEPDCGDLADGCLPPQADEDVGGIGSILPASGVVSVLLASIAAIMYGRRRD